MMPILSLRLVMKIAIGFVSYATEKETFSIIVFSNLTMGGPGWTRVDKRGCSSTFIKRPCKQAVWAKPNVVSLMSIGWRQLMTEFCKNSRKVTCMRRRECIISFLSDVVILSFLNILCETELVPEKVFGCFISHFSSYVEQVAYVLYVCLNSYQVVENITH